MAPVDPEAELPKGYIVTWYDPKMESDYFKLFALIMPPRKVVLAARRASPADDPTLVVHETDLQGVVARVRRRIVLDRDSGKIQVVPGYAISWTRDKVGYKITDYSGVLKVEQLVRIAGSIAF